MARTLYEPFPDRSRPQPRAPAPLAEPGDALREPEREWVSAKVSVCESTCGYVCLYMYGEDLEPPFSSLENLPGSHPLKAPPGLTLPHV